MNHPKILYFLPRVLSIFLILFLATFSLDVFVKGESMGNILLGLVMHLIPNFVILIVLIFACGKELLGGIFFIILAIISIFFFSAYKDIIIFMIVSGPLFLIGFLFVLSSRK